MSPPYPDLEMRRQMSASEEMEFLAQVCVRRRFDGRVPTGASLLEHAYWQHRFDDANGHSNDDNEQCFLLNQSRQRWRW